MGWHQILRLLGFLFFLHSSSLSFASALCPPDQRDSLLLFKNSFQLDGVAPSPCPGYYTSYRGYYTSYLKTNSWIKSVDCCSWDGVTCDGVTGNVVGLDLACGRLHGILHSNSSLFLLHHLQDLNLFGNNFIGSRISPNLSSFAKMTHLNLSRSQFSGTIPSEISHLSKLVSLDLSYPHPYDESNSLISLRLENSIFTMLAQNLTVLRKLFLDSVDMSMVSPKSFVNLSSSLTHLSVSSCSLRGIFPVSVFRLPNLSTLEMDSNEDMSGILPKSNWTGPLAYLSLMDTSFSGEIPNSIGDMKSLSVLSLGRCKFTGPIPSSLGNLKQLESLFLSGNNFSGAVEFEIFRKLQNLRGLSISQELNITDNRLSYAFPKLEALQLRSCNLTKFPYFLSSLQRLIILDLSMNRISGEIPMWFWGICHDTLNTLALSHNLLEGGIPQLYWKSLSIFHLHNNSFQGPLPIPPPSTSVFSASDNGFTGKIPSSICQLSSLSSLNLSNNNLSGNMPQCFGNMTNLRLLDLSSNKFQGPLSSSFLSHNEFNDIFLNTSLLVINLSNNKFGGSIPLPSPMTYYYSIASNKITGKIPSLLCNAIELQVIDLSNNSLIGTLPRCLMNFSTDLSVLNLRMNHLDGTIPQSFSSRNSLTTLDFSQNQFEGILPQSLAKCKNLEVLDIGSNQIEDTFPRWLGKLLELQVLILRSNNFKGLLDFPKGADLFPKLRILDLSTNNFGGPLPANLIMNLRGMNGENGQEKPLYMTRSFRSTPYENSVTVTLKGLETKLVKILTIFTTIDLSHNFFEGDIPGVFGHLHSLKGLNMAHNYLTGSIPPTLGNLTGLEGLDLSSNKLNGEVPRVLGDMASLGYLNLSNNQLTGRIPQDKHLSTFSSDSFSGNPGLCGTPLPKACPGDAPPPPPPSSSTFDRKGHESWFKPKAVLMGYASGIVIGISIAYIALETRRPKWLAQGVRMLERRTTEWMKKPNGKAIKFHGQ
ncbi:Cytokinin riboside 5'-monophosphate phosphoribohydrolase [Psidium guajava]|nr:Cytokinin riboside 5'-monophosphate phosphoribohydrolase [Psidium guajava]